MPEGFEPGRWILGRRIESIMSPSTPERILNAWIELENALRGALPVCSVAPPTQPAELLAALRINHRIDREDEEEILSLRNTRNRVAYQPDEPTEEEADRYEAAVSRLSARLEADSGTGIC